MKTLTVFYNENLPPSLGGKKSEKAFQVYIHIDLIILLYLVSATTFLKVSGSETAISARILRSISIFDFLRPAINFEYERPSSLTAAFTRVIQRDLKSLFLSFLP